MCKHSFTWAATINGLLVNYKFKQQLLIIIIIVHFLKSSDSTFLFL